MTTSDSPRQRLLEAAMDDAAEHGLTDLSLRALAARLGTSHRMLIHHFGSKEGLWTAIVREVERRQIAGIDALIPDPQASFRDAAWAWWRHISDPALWPSERLFFETYSQALQGRPHTTSLLDDVVTAWLAPIEAVGAAAGVSGEHLQAFARLSLAVIRGLLLDLLATRDRSAVDAAMGLWIDLNDRQLIDTTGSRRGQ